MKNINCLLAIIVYVFAVSCSKEPVKNTESAEVIHIEVVDGGFGGTRATEDGFTTVFTPGDRIGLFMLEDGAISPSVNNLCFTAVEGADGLVWQADSEFSASLLDVEKNVFYAYYPYVDELPAQVNPAASGDEGFFAAVADAWAVAEDQTDYEDYTASDFMTATGALSGNNLDFSMKHRMALTAVILPHILYVFTNEDVDLPNYSILPSNLSFEGFAPCILSNGAFGYLVNPADWVSREFSGQYGQGSDVSSWSFEPEIVAGQYHRYVIDDAEAVEVRHELQVGDFFLADGSLLSKDADEQTVKASDVIGIVFQIDPARIGAGEKAALDNEVHGLVVASKSVQNDNFFEWYLGPDGNYERDETEIGIENYVGGDSYNTFLLLNENDIEGYEANRLIREKRSADFDAGHYPAFKAAYESSDPSLFENTTGWYIPTTGQWFDMIANFTGISLAHDNFWSGEATDFYWENLGYIMTTMNNMMSKVSDEDKNLFSGNGYYWTASTATADMARYIGVRDYGSTVMSVATYKKDFLYVRCILAF